MDSGLFNWGLVFVYVGFSVICIVKIADQRDKAEAEVKKLKKRLAALEKERAA